MKQTQKLLDVIIKGIQEKKSSGIVIVDLRKIDGAVADYFVICQGGSPSQVEAISESAYEHVLKECGEKPVGVNGLSTDQWVAIDYVDIMLHIFLPEPRAFYDLEHLWEDADITELPDEQ